MPRSLMTVSMARHAIVIPTKNRLSLLKRAIESVRTQAYTAWRLVIVNDGSTDGTRDFLDELASHDARIVVVHRDESGGVNAARNAALRLLEEDEFVTFLDDDDYFEPGALAEMSRLLEDLPPEVSMVCCNTFYQDPSGKHVQGYRFEEGDSFRVPSYADAMTKNRVTGDSLATFRASLYAHDDRYQYREDVNGFETEIFLKMVRDGVGVRYVPLVVATKDHSHDSPHLSQYAASSDPSSFARAHERIFRDHSVFFSRHPGIAASRAIAAGKVAIRAGDFRRSALFGWYWLRARIRIITGERHEEKQER